MSAREDYAVDINDSARRLRLLFVDEHPPRGGTIMREYKRYWLDYDSVSLAILMVGIAVVELLAFSI